jgi:4-coumarate--CoA ligase
VTLKFFTDEISRQLINSDAKIIFGLSSNSNILETAVKLTERSIKIVYVRQNSNESIPRHGIAFDELIKTEKVDLNNFKQFQRDNSEIALLPYSSGTTGLSKGVLLTHKNIVCNSIMHNSDTGKGKLAHEAIGNHQDIVPCVLPFFHIYGLVVCLLSKLAIGCKLVTLNKFHPDTFLNVLHDYKSSILYIVPPIGNL